MSQTISARRPYFRTAQLRRQQAHARERRVEGGTFFAQHLASVKTRLHAACRPYDRQRRALHRKQVQAAHDSDVSEEVCRAAGTTCKPQLWETEGDSN